MGTAEQTLIVLAVMAVLFVTEIIPLAITSLGGAITLGLMGIITPKVVFSGLSDSTVCVVRWYVRCWCCIVLHWFSSKKLGKQ